MTDRAPTGSLTGRSSGQVAANIADADHDGAGGRGDRTVLTLGMVALVALLIGANYSVMQLALRHTTPLVLTGLRLAIGGSALLAYTRWRGESLPRDPRVLAGIFGVSICVTTISSMTLVTGVSLVPAGVAALLSSLVPVWTAVLAFGLLNEQLGRSGGVGVAVGLAGAVVLSSPAIEGDTSMAGVAILTISGIAWAAGIVLLRWWDFGGVSPVMITTVQLLMSTVVVIPIALVVEGTGSTDFSIDLLLPLLYAAIPSLAVTFALMAKVTVEASATQASSVAYLTPVFGVLFAWIIRDNTLSLPEWVGGGLLVVGVMLVTGARPAIS
ncbi:MAG: EamA family transporter [Acidimicrobiia bacterium]|nr:EamA family transporter [Acidimicrobiia bacterium]